MSQAESTSQQMEERFKAHARHQTAMVELSALALGGPDIAALLKHAVQHVAAALQVEIVRVLELQPDRKTFLLRAAFGDDGLAVGSEMTGAGTDTQAGFTLAANEPVVMSNLATEKR